MKEREESQRVGKKGEESRRTRRTEEVGVSHPLDGLVDVGDGSQGDLGVHRIDHAGDEPVKKRDEGQRGNSSTNEGGRTGRTWTQLGAEEE